MNYWRLRLIHSTLRHSIISSLLSLRLFSLPQSSQRFSIKKDKVENQLNSTFSPTYNLQPRTYNLQPLLSKTKKPRSRRGFVKNNNTLFSELFFLF
jgi:hypothetical protein